MIIDIAQSKLINNLRLIIESVESLGWYHWAVGAYRGFWDYFTLLIRFLVFFALAHVVAAVGEETIITEAVESRFYGVDGNKIKFILILYVMMFLRKVWIEEMRKVCVYPFWNFIQILVSVIVFGVNNIDYWRLIPLLCKMLEQFNVGWFREIPIYDD